MTTVLAHHFVVAHQEDGRFTPHIFADQDQFKAWIKQQPTNHQIIDRRCANGKMQPPVDHRHEVELYDDAAIPAANLPKKKKTGSSEKKPAQSTNNNHHRKAFMNGQILPQPELVNHVVEQLRQQHPQLAQKYAKRLLRAIDLATSGHVFKTQHQPGQYKVRSQSDNVHYDVDLNAKSCSCPDFAAYCKHRRAAYIAKEAKKAAANAIIEADYTPGENIPPVRVRLLGQVANGKGPHFKAEKIHGYPQSWTVPQDAVSNIQIHIGESVHQYNVHRKKRARQHDPSQLTLF